MNSILAMTEFFQYLSTILQSTAFILGSFVCIAFVVPVLLKKRLTRDKLGSVVMTIGVLGTFLGVTVALYHFDVANIRESLPNLLSGLKTAFITSIAGMIAAIILKVSSSGICRKYTYSGDDVELVV